MKMALVSAFLVLLLLTPAAASPSTGIKTKPSPHSVMETVQRFEKAAKAKGMRVFPRIDHAAAARSVGEVMPSAIVVSVGNPKYGTKFMLENPVAAIDFPPKAVVYEDDSGKVWISYNTADYLYRTIFERHGLKYPEGDISFYTKVLEELTDAAVSPKSTD
ncbi:MAG: DUF302 domain-containing protein [Pseudomonadota bacterium]